MSNYNIFKKNTLVAKKNKFINKIFKKYFVYAGVPIFASLAIAVPIIVVELNRNNSADKTDYWSSLKNIFKNVNSKVIATKNISPIEEYELINEEIIKSLGMQNFPIGSLGSINYYIKHKGIKEDGFMYADIKAVNKNNKSEKFFTLPIEITGINIFKIKNFFINKEYNTIKGANNLWISEISINQIIDDLSLQIMNEEQISTTKQYLNLNSFILGEIDNLKGEIKFVLNINNEKINIVLSGFYSINKIIEEKITNIDKDIAFSSFRNRDITTISESEVARSLADYISRNLTKKESIHNEEITKKINESIIKDLKLDKNLKTISFTIKFNEISKEIEFKYNI